MGVLASVKKRLQIVGTIVQVGGLSLKFTPKTSCRCVSTSDRPQPHGHARVDAKSDTTRLSDEIFQRLMPEEVNQFGKKRALPCQCGSHIANDTNRVLKSAKLQEERESNE